MILTMLVFPISGLRVPLSAKGATTLPPGAEAPARLLAASELAAAISAGREHTCALTASGGVKCWGNNSEGELGNGTFERSAIPVEVSNLDSVVTAITAGGEHTCALMDSGGVKCWGNNLHGQLGNGTFEDSNVPLDVNDLDSGVSAVSSGGLHTCTLMESGGVKCWGDNTHGELGDGTFEPSTNPVDVSNLTSGVSAISAGRWHTCALMDSGGVKCWGYNSYGQLGNAIPLRSNIPVDVSDLSSGVSAVFSGGEHTCALMDSGGVKCWGDNLFGQLGDGTWDPRNTPVDVSGLSSGVSAIATGYYHTCALTDSGEVKCWGYNEWGQLGDGTSQYRYTPVDVSDLSGEMSSITAGGEHTCAQTDDGGVKCWGHNLYGQLGDGTFGGYTLPVDVRGHPIGVSAIAAGGEHTCALTHSGGVKCWGDNSEGQLGDGSTIARASPVDVSGPISGVSAIAAGDFHTCALMQSGGIRCWGDNAAGQLGDGTISDRHFPVDVSGLPGDVDAVAAGAFHTCALMDSGGVMCWGLNSNGQLGNGNNDDVHIPVEVSGLDSGVSAIVAGGFHTCALTDYDGVKCWGHNNWGQLGDGTSEDTVIPAEVQNLSSGVSALAVGNYHTCALMTSGGVKCWGRNLDGQIGDGSYDNADTPVDVHGLLSGVSALTAGGHHTCALTQAGGVKCWGRNLYGQLGDGTRDNRKTPVEVSGLTSGVSAINAGFYHTCALTTSSRVKCCGYNQYGQIGNGIAMILPHWVFRLQGPVIDIYLPAIVK